MKILIKKLKKVKTPIRAHSTDAGIDLYIPEYKDNSGFGFTPKGVVIEAGHFYHLKLGIAIELPKNTVGIIQAKSGYASKKGISTIGNIIDEGYTGEISVTLVNNGYEKFKLKNGDKVCQLLIVPILYPEIELTNKITKSDRGDNGFGSTGKQ